MKAYTKPGEFFLGCNYWASDVGIRMWSQWNEETVRNDFRCLAEHGIRTVRVFPTWSDFQPIQAVTVFGGHIDGFSVDDGTTLLYDNTDTAGIDPTMMARFGTLLDIAEENGLLIIPSIVTGWMSGRLFAPEALRDRNLLCDPLAIKWEVRFVRQFVRAFRDRKCITAWCLGNECNCCAKVETEEQAWLWTSCIANAIRAEDHTRSVISGMHSLRLPGEGLWTMEAQGENCDILTTHPYASPTYKTDSCVADQFRAVMHPACQTAMYRDISHKPCIIEETGTFGEMYCDEELTATYSRNVLFNAWAHDCRAYLWWIAFDQGHLRYHPFGYNNRASNYGLFRADYSEKPIYGSLARFNDMLAKFPYDTLPQAIVDGVCVLTPGQSSWACGSGAFYMAKQVGMNLQFAHIEDTLPDAPVYFVPSINTNSVGVEALDALMQRVADGAVLYLSVDRGFFRNLSTAFGFHIRSREEIRGADTITFCGADEGFTVMMSPELRYHIDLTSAECLARASDGTPVFTCADYGKGKVFFLACPIEKQLFDAAVGYDKGHHRIYEAVRRQVVSNRWLHSTVPNVTLTEHPTENGTRVIVAVNNTNQPQTVACTLLSARTLIGTYYGEAPTMTDTAATLTLQANDAVVFELK